jgi:uncharacterized membrane protein
MAAGRLAGGPPMTSPAPRHRLRTYLATGLLIWIPVTVTFFVIRFVVNLIDQVLLVIPAAWRPEAVLGFRVPGLGILLAFLVLLATGLLFTNLVGLRLVASAERLLARIPFVGPIYKASKQVTETVLSPEGKAFRHVVLVRWPHRDSRAVAFVTGAAPAEIASRTGTRFVQVYVPTTPNPTSGFLLLVPEEDVLALEMSVDEAFRMVVSLGVVLPDWPRADARAAAPGPARRLP